MTTRVVTLLWMLVTYACGGETTAVGRDAPSAQEADTLHADGVGAAANHVANSTNDAPRDQSWLWMPSWRDRGDCGPNSLFVMLRLLGKTTTLADVKKLIPIDSERGCSIDTLAVASSTLGVPMEARFVPPNEFQSLPFPFVVHGWSGVSDNRGHFTVVVGYDPVKRNFALIDPVLEQFGWHGESSLLLTSSGYVLLPTRSRWSVGEIVLTVFLFVFGVLLLQYIFRSASFSLRRGPRTIH